MWKGGRSLRQKQQNNKNQHDKKKYLLLKISNGTKYILQTTTQHT